MAFKRGSQPGVPPGMIIPNNTSATSPTIGAAAKSGYEPAPARDPVSARDVAAYMADMLAELQELAHDSGFETLRRLLEIAECEAKWQMQERP